MTTSFKLPRLAVVILNWRQADATLECVSSVASLDYDNLDIYICDNDSQDGSFEKILSSVSASLENINALRAEQALHRFELAAPLSAPARSSPCITQQLDDGIRRITVLDTGKNGGYAYGNNVALRLALQQSSIEFFWILNNDTVVDRLAARGLVDAMRADETIGICGSTVLYMNSDKVQTLGGGRFLPWKARCEQVGTGMSFSEISAEHDVERSLDYINGASAMVTRRFLQTVGLMDEMYFLYYEEIDWAVRARSAGFRLGYWPESLVYHQVGASSGTADEGDASNLSVYYAERSKFKFLLKHYPSFLLVAIPLLGREYVRRIARRRRASANAMLRGAFKAFIR